MEPTEEQLHQVSLILGDPKAVGLEWLRKFASDLRYQNPHHKIGKVDYRVIRMENLIEWAEQHIREAYTKSPCTYVNAVSKSNGYLPAEVPPEFWTHLSNYLEKPIPDICRNNFFY